jgi:hypothetical protein
MQFGVIFRDEGVGAMPFLRTRPNTDGIRRRVYRPRRVVTVAALLILISSAAYPADTIPEVLKNNWLAVVWLAGGALLGWLGKMASEIITGRATARRAFIDKTTGQISDLAKEHYWGLANHAGVLAAALEEYLYMTDYHMLLAYDDPAGLTARLDDMAETYSNRTFYDLCRLIWLFDRFHLAGSNTYLLTSDVAGRACRQLYNDFVTALSGDSEAEALDTLAILDVMGRLPERDEPAKPGGPTRSDEKAPDKQKSAPTGSDLTRREFNKRFVDSPKGDLRKVRGAYRDWLRSHLDNVTWAAQALRAYNELLCHELANLYRGWFKPEPYSALPFAKAVTHDRWPDILSKDSVVVIARALAGSELLQSIARGPSTRDEQPSTAEDSAGSGAKKKERTPRGESADQRASTSAAAAQ